MSVTDDTQNRHTRTQLCTKQTSVNSLQFGSFSKRLTTVTATAKLGNL
jgi:hypothetical protein